MNNDEKIYAQYVGTQSVHELLFEDDQVSVILSDEIEQYVDQLEGMFNISLTIDEKDKIQESLVLYCYDELKSDPRYLLMENGEWIDTKKAVLLREKDYGTHKLARYYYVESCDHVAVDFEDGNVWQTPDEFKVEVREMLNNMEGGDKLSDKQFDDVCSEVAFNLADYDDQDDLKEDLKDRLNTLIASISR